MIWLSQTIQYRIWPPRPSLEYLLNYKTFSGFPSLDWNCYRLNGTCEPTISSRIIFLIRRHENQLPYFSSSSISKSSIYGGWEKTILKGNFYKYRAKKNGYSFWQVGHFKRRRFLSSTLYFLLLFEPRQRASSQH